VNSNFENRKETTTAVSAVRDCADTMASQAEWLQRALPDLVMGETLRASALKWSESLRDTSQRAMFELALLQAQLSEDRADPALVLRRLSGLDAAMMDVVAGSTELVEQLEKVAESDEAQEPTFAVVIEMVARLMAGCESAQAATRALRDAPP
jgi:hypothetical protein